MAIFQEVKEKVYDDPCQAVIARDPVQLCGATKRCKHARLEEKHQQPKGPMVKVILENHLRGVTSENDEDLPVSINGYRLYVPKGEKTEIPDDYVTLIETCKSTTKVPDLAKRERVPQRGRPTDPSRLDTYEYHNDYTIHRLG